MRIFFAMFITVHNFEVFVSMVISNKNCSRCDSEIKKSVKSGGEKNIPFFVTGWWYVVNCPGVF